MKVGLRVCVNSLHGALEGVPNLLRLFEEYKILGSFFFALGPDRSGRLFSQARGLPVEARRYSFASRLKATLAPALIADHVSEVMRSTAAAGHEVGLLSYDPQAWCARAAHADQAWTHGMLTQAVEAYEGILGEKPKCHAAAGWQVNSHVLKIEQDLGFQYATDVKGRHPFLPRLMDVDYSCPQIPTTLPTLTDLLGREAEVTAENVHEYLYAESQYVVPHGHVYTLNAELDGLDYLPVMEKLAVMWRGADGGIVPLGTLLQGVGEAQLKRHMIGWAQEEGSSVHLARQALPV